MADMGSVDGWPFFIFVKCWYLLLIDRYLMISAAECGVSSVPGSRGLNDGGKCQVLWVKWPLPLHALVVNEGKLELSIVCR